LGLWTECRERLGERPCLRVELLENPGRFLLERSADRWEEDAVVDGPEVVVQVLPLPRSVCVDPKVAHEILADEAMGSGLRRKLEVHVPTEEDAGIWIPPEVGSGPAAGQSTTMWTLERRARVERAASSSDACATLGSCIDRDVDRVGGPAVVQQDQPDTVAVLSAWASSRPDVRVVLITSNRAIPDAKVDAYSDFDVILVVSDVESLVTDKRWVSDFGDVLVAYWDPVETDPGTDSVSVSSITQFVSGLKIDFTLWSRQRLQTVVTAPELLDELDAGYRVLVDKDDLTSALRPPTYAAYVPTAPDEETYLRLIGDFFIGPPYVAKSLLRDELLPAKWVLDFDMRHNYFVPMLEWRVECDHDWSLKPGSLGKGLKSHLPGSFWAEFEATFAGADTPANWDALMGMMSLFGRVAREVAASLGFIYPQDLEDQVTRHVRRMRDGVFAAGPLINP